MLRIFPFQRKEQRWGQFCFFLWMITSYVIRSPVYVVTTFCGENMCLCDASKHLATCRSERTITYLSYFPKLPNYITDVTFKDFIRPNISREDLTNLTYLSLKYLQLKSMDMERVFSSLSPN